MSLNVVCLMGRLTANPELKHTQSGIPVVSFTIAADRTFTPKGQEKQADFINCVAWRNTAEFVEKYFRKGSMIIVQGSIQTRSYTDKDGNKRTAFEVLADQVFFGESKRDNAPNVNADQPQFSAPATSDFEEIVGSDELPF
jgi:single-strand DNA-binding protein